MGTIVERKNKSGTKYRAQVIKKTWRGRSSQISDFRAKNDCCGIPFSRPYWSRCGVP